MWILCSLCEGFIDPDEAIRLTASAMDGVLLDQHMVCLTCANRMGFFMNKETNPHESAS